MAVPIFRNAAREDAPAIAELHNALVQGQRPAAEGFLLAPTTPAALLEKLDQGVHMFVATSPEGVILGFVTVSVPRLSPACLAAITGLQEPDRAQLLAPGHLYIQVVATRPDQRGRGIGRFLYQSLYRRFPDAFFTAFVVSRPVTNQRSLRFHQLQGFRPIGSCRRAEFCGLKNYESILLLRQR